MFLSPYYWLFSLSFVSLFYSNFYLLVPKLYFNKKQNQYILVLLFLFVIFYFLKPFSLMFMHYLMAKKWKITPMAPLAVDTATCILFIIVISIGFAIQSIRHSRVTERRALLAEAEKAQAELSFLKAQVNPHFLFNTLNNIYSLSLDKDAITSDSILKLSNLMRYITDEATKDFVPLENEIACLQDYIDLQWLRLEDNIKVDFSVTGNFKDKQIAPLILITYIENAFKYGISSREEAGITIRIAVEEEKIVFYCQNRIFPVPRVTERTGIGQVNTRQRLNYLYPKKHNLTISTDNSLYTVELTLQT
jgi:two-component system LytT family sensor kinase